ncbi:MAG: efflux RND transporter periplasmic adaptor subunit [Thermodesulfovibrionales bacterium]|nr:efflux RND transporter periplasmic adaptor subunit [Thermodesulfovibrionales bacterium]
MQKEDLGSLRIEKGSISVKKKRRAFLIFVPLALLIFVAYLIFTSAPYVEITSVSLIYPSRSISLLSASGYVVADRKAALGVKTTGTLEWLGVKEGDTVIKGQIIGRLENEDRKIYLEQARANLELALASLREAEAELYDARLTFERNRELFERGFLSKAEYDASEARLRRAEAMVSQRKAHIKVAEAQVREAEVNLEYTYIKVPFDGVVLTKDADVGDIVTPLGAAANARASVVTIADMDSIHVEVDVSEQNISKVKQGQACEIELDAFPDKRFRGRVLKIIPTADRTKASIKVKIAILDKEKGIIPDMSAKVSFLEREISQEELRPVIAVKTSSVLFIDKKGFVFVYEGGRLKKRQIVTGKELNGFTEILDGLKAGESVVSNPSDKLKDGMKVKVKEK